MASGQKKIPKELVIIILAGVLLLFAIIMTVLQFNNLRALRTAVEDEEMAVMEARAVLNRRMEHRANAAEYEARIRVLEIMLPENPQEEEILRYFDNLADEYDLNVEQINFGGRVENVEAGYVRMPLTITLGGRYHNLTNFLAHLYEGGRAVRVDDVNINLAATPEFPANIRATISANAFYTLN